MTENSNFKDQSLSDSLIASQVEEKRRSLRGRRKSNFSSFFEEPVLEETPVSDSSTATQAKKKPRTSRGRKKRDSTLSEDLLLKPENIFDSLIANQVKEKPRTLRGRKKRDFPSSRDDSLLKNESNLDSLTASQENEKPRASRGRKKRRLSSFTGDHVSEQRSISESSIASSARRKPRANTASRVKKGIDEEPSLIPKRNSTLLASLNQSSAGKDLNLLMCTAKSEFDFQSQPGNTTYLRVKEEIDTKKQKPRRTYGRKKRKGGRRKKEEDPSYHATFKSDIETYDFTTIADNYGNCKYLPTRSCNLINAKRNLQNCELDTTYVNNVSNAPFRPPVPSTYSEILNYQSMCEDVQRLNVSSEFPDIPHSNVKSAQFIKTERKFLQNKDPHLHPNLDNSVDLETLTEEPISHVKLDSLKYTDRNHNFLPEYCIRQPENKSGLRCVSMFSEVSGCEKGSETFTTPTKRVKIDQKFEKKYSSLFSERSYDLEEITVFKECVTPKKSSTPQSLVDTIKNEHNYYCMSIAKNCDVSSSNLDSHNSSLNQNSSNELKDLGSIKIKKENFGALEPNVPKHLVLGSGYFWKPINRNSTSDVPETSLVFSEKTMTSSLENIPNKHSTLNADDYLNSSSNAAVHQKEVKNSSFSFTNVIPEDYMYNQQAIRKKGSRKRKNIVKPRTSNPILNNLVNSSSSQVCLWPADHPEFPQANSCDTPTKMVAVTYAAPQTNACNNKVEMSDITCVSHQVNVLRTEHGLPAYPVLYQKHSLFSNVQVTGVQIQECNSFQNQNHVPAIMHSVPSSNETFMDTAVHSTAYQNQSVLGNSSGCNNIMTAVTYPSFCQNQSVLANSSSDEAAMTADTYPNFCQNQSIWANSSSDTTTMTAVTYPSFYQDRSNLARRDKTVMSAVTYPNFYQNQSALENSISDKSVMTDFTYPNFCQNQGALENSISDKSLMTGVTYPNFCQNHGALENSVSDKSVMTSVTYPNFARNQDALENSINDNSVMTGVKYPKFRQNDLILTKRRINARNKRKSSNPKQHAINFPEKKEHVMTNCKPNSLQHRMESLSLYNSNQGISSKIQASSAVVSTGSRKDLRCGNHYSQSKNADTLPNLPQSDIEILDLTDDISELDDDVFERKNDHSKIYVKAEIDDEADYTLPDSLRQELVECLSEQYLSGKMTLDDILCSENPFIRYYAFDAILFDIFPQK